MDMTPWKASNKVFLTYMLDDVNGSCEEEVEEEE
jgi:hypothetical protein